MSEPYLDDWCADPTLAHELCTNGACECRCHAALDDDEGQRESAGGDDETVS